MEPNAMGTPPMIDTMQKFNAATKRPPNSFGVQPRTAAEQQMDAGPLGQLGAQQRAQQQFTGSGAGAMGQSFAAPQPNAQPATQAFGANNNLIGTQINPTNSASTNTAQGYTQKAGAAFDQFNLGQFQGVKPLAFGAERGMLAGAGQQMAGQSLNFGGANAQYGKSENAMQGLQALGQQNFGSGSASADTSKFNSELNTALDGLKGPNRGEIGAETMSLLEARSRPGYDQTLRDVGAKNAAMGRRGSGITTNELGDVTLARERELSLARRDVSNDAAAQTLKDRLDISNQQRGVANDRFGAEVANAGFADAGLARDQQGRQFGASLQRGIAGDIANNAMQIGDRFGDQERDRGALGERQAGFSRTLANDYGNLTRDEYGAEVDERNTARKDEYDQGDFAKSKFTTMNSYLGDERTNDYNQRQETRGERGYQYGLSRDAVGDEMDRANLEERTRQGRFNRASVTANTGFGAESPGGAYGQSANNYRQSSADNFEGAGQSLASMGNRRRRTDAGGGQ